MNYSEIKKINVANGNGIRVDLFVSGCTNHCPGCFNPETWDFNHGNLFTDEVADYIINLLNPDWMYGLSVLGGEPFQQDKTLFNFLKRVKETYPDKKLWCYTGYLYERIRNNPLLRYIDVLVDGPFLLAERNPSLRFRGSANQRIIDVHESLRTGNVVLWKDDEYERYQKA